MPKSDMHIPWGMYINRHLVKRLLTFGETTPKSEELLGGPSLDAPETVLGVVPQFSLNSAGNWELAGLYFLEEK
jgi:hypothetical protein